MISFLLGKKYRNICMIRPRGTPRRTTVTQIIGVSYEICSYHSDTFQIQVTENPAQTGLSKNEIYWLVTIKSRSMLASALIGSGDSDTVTGTWFLSPFLNSVSLGCSHVLIGLSCTGAKVPVRGISRLLPRELKHKSQDWVLALIGQICGCAAHSLNSSGWKPGPLYRPPAGDGVSTTQTSPVESGKR